jgi:hypothetical protein
VYPNLTHLVVKKLENYLNLNIMIKKISHIFTLIMLFSLLVSGCSNDTERQNDNHNNIFVKEAKFVYDSFKTIESETNNPNSRILTGDELNQETLDYYIDLIGLEPNSVSLSDINQIIDDLSVAYENDVESVIAQSPYSSFTKNKLIEISNGNIVVDFNEIPEFAELDLTEKDILNFSNSVAIEFINNAPIDETSNRTEIPCPSSACGIGFAIAGGISGSAICGIPCGIGGAIIGMIIGTAGK